MGRTKNDGKGRLGGRTKGTPNKPAAPLTVWALNVVNKNRAQLEKDLPGLSPDVRAGVLASLATIAASSVAAETV